jgi:hypothetical protein
MPGADDSTQITRAPVQVKGQSKACRHLVKGDAKRLEALVLATAPEIDELQVEPPSAQGFQEVAALILGSAGGGLAEHEDDARHVRDACSR